VRFWIVLLVLWLSSGPVWASPLDRAATQAWASGLQALAREDWPTALTALHRTVSLPDYPKYEAKRLGALSNRCLVYIQLQHYRWAIADCSAALAAGPTEAALLNRGIAYHRLHRFERAAADFTAALRLVPHSAEAWLDRALLYRDWGQLQQARHDLQRAATCCDRRGPLYRYIRQTLESLPGNTATA